MKVVVTRMPETIDECRYHKLGTYYNNDGPQCGIYCRLTGEICPFQWNSHAKCDALISVADLAETLKKD